MPVHVDRATLQAAVDAVARHGNAAAAARELGLAEMTLKSRLKQAERAGITRSESVVAKDDPAVLKAEVRRLEREIAKAQKDALDHAAIKRAIIGLKQGIDGAEPPKWLLRESKPSAPGVPTLFLSDLHWGEVVHPSQINGVNRYNLAIAKQRLRACAERTIRLLKIFSPEMDYPGIVLALGGDMISGNIHDELTATNEINSMPAVLDLYGELVGLIEALADTFGKVFIPGVTGNHGRDTHKIWSKDRHHTSFDWLLYQFLRKRFENDKRVTFLIPDGPDAYWRVYGYRYLMTHGDQFRGGDGMIGALGPIIRGDYKKRSRNAQIDMEYDTLLVAHWHQYIHLRRLVVNGSLKGLDEYAYSNNFPHEPPQQALWLTHPDHGMTLRAPVYVDRTAKAAKTAWISVAA